MAGQMAGMKGMGSAKMKGRFHSKKKKGEPKKAPVGEKFSDRKVVSNPTDEDEAVPDKMPHENVKKRMTSETY